jgi:hypothetical protein
MRQMAPDLLLHQSLMKLKHSLECPTAKQFTHPRSTGLISAITRSIGCDRCRWNTSLSAPALRVVDPPRHFRQQPVVPNIVKVGAQIKVEDTRLPPDYRLATRLIAS